MSHEEMMLVFICGTFTLAMFLGYLIGADENQTTKIDITNNETNSNVVYNTEPVKVEKEESLKDQLDEFIDVYSHEIAEHFDEFGWSLLTDCYQSYIMDDIFGMDVGSYIRTQILIKTGCRLTYNSTMGAMYSKKDGYYPIYMDNSTGEIKVIENADIDKSYIFNHRDEDGFTEIGFL